MKLVVGAPVAAREWALPYWFQCLKAQTRPPDEYVFIVKDVEGDRSRQLLHKLGPKIPKLSYAIDSTPYIPREARNRHGVEYVYKDFAKRRNHLLKMARKRHPDVFFSLDTDIMLEDPETIERLLAHLEKAPVAAPLTYLHETGEASECFNAGFWQGGEPGSPERAWRRATVTEAKGVVDVDIPMAAVMMRREVMDCRYAFHICGEDLGFAQDLDRLGLRCLWDTDLYARHVMRPEHLQPLAAAV